MKMARWLAGSLAALGLVLAAAPANRAQALSLANPGLVAPIKAAANGDTTEVRFHGGGRFHGGFHRGGGHRFHGGFHRGGFHRFHGGFHRRVFFRPRYYAYRPYYIAPVYRCPLVMTVYGPRRICVYRRHHVRYWHRHRFVHRHHYYHRRWM